jgi:hypothetical protein
MAPVPSRYQSHSRMPIQPAAFFRRRELLRVAHGGKQSLRQDLWSTEIFHHRLYIATYGKQTPMISWSEPRPQWMFRLGSFAMDVGDRYTISTFALSVSIQ